MKTLEELFSELAQNVEVEAAAYIYLRPRVVL